MVEIEELLNIHKVLEESNPWDFDEEQKKRYMKVLAELNKKNEQSKIRTLGRAKKTFVL